MRTARRLLTYATVLGVAALSTGVALAAREPVSATSALRPGTAEPAERERAGGRKSERGREQRRDRDAGRVVPVVGRPDYGTAENRFGAARSGHVHAGQDIFAPAGTPVVAAADGVVAERGSDAGQGNYVYLYDPRREQTYVYMHLIEPARAGAGERVEAGQALGGVGCTGSCWGDHLHFEVRAGRGIVGQARDPLAGLQGWQQLARPR